MVIFLILALIITLTALGVVLFRNPINSALCLIANMLCIAGLFAMLEAHFLATVQVIVYAGAIMVLVVFLLMLLNYKMEAPRKLRLLYSISAAICAVFFLWMVVPQILNFFDGFRYASPAVAGSVRAMGEVLYVRYVYLFEVASVLILAALVGAVMLGKRTYREK